MENVLIITVGVTPQIVTETVWALLTRDPPFVPTKIILATTRDSAEVFEHKRLLGRTGKLCELYHYLGRSEDYVEPEIRFAEGADGARYHDVRTQIEASAFGDLITRLVAEHGTSDSRIHVSMAGGRKTMSWFAGAALSLVGRPTDELSHVLVDPEELEQCEDFWWPTREDNPITHRSLRNGDATPRTFNTRLRRDPGDTSGAMVEMARIPFVPLRPYLDGDVFEGGGIGYDGVVARANAVLHARYLEIDVPARRIRFGGREAELQNKEMAYYALAALAKKQAWAISRTNDGEFGWLNPARVRGLATQYFELYCETHIGDARKRLAWIDADVFAPINGAAQLPDYGKSAFQIILEDDKRLQKDLRELRADIKKTIYNSFRNRWLSEQATIQSKGAMHGLVFPAELIRLTGVDGVSRPYGGTR